jgi:hypothetical protein
VVVSVLEREEHALVVWVLERELKSYNSLS